MKRRTFVKTVLGALAAVGVGNKLIDSESQKPVTKIAGNDGPKGCEGVLTQAKLDQIANRLNNQFGVPTGKDGQVLYLTPNGYEWRDLV